MADDVNVTPGSGAVIATRQLSDSSQAQRVIPQTWSTPGSSGGTATDVGTTNPLPVSAVLKDGVTSNLATVAVFHNADNQNPAGLGFGLLTGGVAQLINVSGNLDRQRETGIDNIPAVGIASGTQQVASPFSTTVATSIATGTQVVTPASMTGFNRGAAWSIQQGSVLTVSNSNGSNSENVVVTAVTGTTFTATYQQTKTGPGILVNGYTYNQARDATTPDGSTGQGFAAGATFLFNPTLNSANGGWESERSAAGELDGATGSGAAIAAEYENNSGGPVLTSGKASALQYDRGRNVQGKGLGTATISTGATNGSTSIVVTSAAAVNLLQPGSPLYLLTGSALTEVVYVSNSYVPGTATINLQNAVVTGGETTVAFDIYAPSGPGLSGFLPTGIEIADEAVWDPVSNRFYLERSATADASAPANVPLESPALFNGSTMDREYNNTTGTLMTSAAQTATIASGSQTNFNARGVTIYVNVTANSGTTPTLQPVFQGQDPITSNWFALIAPASAIAAANTTWTFMMYPGIATTATTPIWTYSAALPRIWRVNFIIGGTTPSITFSAGFSYTV